MKLTGKAAPYDIRP